MKDSNLQFILMMADNNMILGQRLGEWCGHGPVLEQDIALTNIALDLIGEARLYYQYAAEIEGREEDYYPMLRDIRAFRCSLLVQQPNGNWGDTIMRQFIYDCYHFYLLHGLTGSKDQNISNIAQKCVKEASYHISFSSEWVVRLGDGTEESHQKISQSYRDLIPFAAELWTASTFETEAINDGVSPDLNLIGQQAMAKINEVLHRATIKPLEQYVSRSGGKKGMHTEHLGYILAEMQHLQRAYLGATW
jgi:ring-1,2-phenylacetyl-CoA epoxidase subunit PaaC